MKKEPINQLPSRRKFLRMASFGIAALTMAPQLACKGGKMQQPTQVQGLENEAYNPDDYKGWGSVSNRKIRMGIVGYGFCKFGAEFGFQNHPNVEVVAVSDLFPDRCAGLAKACRCNKTYPSLEELVKDDRIDAILISTDAPSHVRHTIEALRHGKHVAVNVPAVFGSLEDADKLFEEVKKSGLKYMMFETSFYRADNFAMHQLYKSGGLGEIIYSEGEYYHYMPEALPSYKDWRVGLPPQFYPTHSNAYYVCVTGGSFTEVSCLGMPSLVKHCTPENNRYSNPFATEIALFRTNKGGIARMGVSWDTPGDSGERGRIRGQKGSFYEKYEGLEKILPNLKRPPIPPGVDAGGHGGSHGRLTDEFVTAILQDRNPVIDISMALNLTVPGIVAHQSALKDGELMNIPQYKI
jgi:predicted dehydrogenase